MSFIGDIFIGRIITICYRVTVSQISFCLRPKPVDLLNIQQSLAYPNTAEDLAGLWPSAADKKALEECFRPLVYNPTYLNNKSNRIRFRHYCLTFSTQFLRPS